MSKPWEVQWKWSEHFLHAWTLILFDGLWKSHQLLCLFLKQPKKIKQSQKKRMWKSERERQTIRVYTALIREMCRADDCICGLCLEPLNVRLSRDFNLFYPIGPSCQDQMESIGRLLPDLEHKCNIITWKHCTLFCSQCSWGTNLKNNDRMCSSPVSTKTKPLSCSAAAQTVPDLWSQRNSRTQKPSISEPQSPSLMYSRSP